ncbi:MAG TPA: alpha/beta family hydrolase [Thermoanaerobaculia bacterium]|nr:alpha/beta family hydrolase [Thermoanaerobaculia bacterium]
MTSGRADSDLLFDGSEDAPVTVVLAHGAGAPMNTPFLNSVARGLSAGGGVRVARFEFPYMRARRETGRRGGAPDREPVLRNSWKEVVERLGGGRKVVIGGKSMGGRIASMVADEVGARGLVCLGYPFHPPGRPDKLRTRHLETLATPALIVQGTRDAFGTPEDVAGYVLSDAIRVVWLEDGDHSWKPRAASGRTEAQNMADGVAAIREFLEALDS